MCLTNGHRHHQHHEDVLTLDVDVKGTQHLVAIHVRSFYHHWVFSPQEHRVCNSSTQRYNTNLDTNWKQC